MNSEDTTGSQIDQKLVDSRKALQWLTKAMLICLISVIAYAIATQTNSIGFAAIASIGILLSGASAFIGGVLGFLFGIPRTLEQEEEKSNTKLNSISTEAGTSTPHIGYRVNTNLEEISDWLTKIIVGVSLTQISAIHSNFMSLITFIDSGLGSQTHGKVFAAALLLYSAVLGFLFGYLWTRLFLAGALRKADQDAIGNLATKVETTERKLNAFQKQSEQDANALNLAYRQLNPSSDLPQITQGELDSAIAVASQHIKIQILNKAWQVRSENWQDVKNKPKMELTIPLFRALIHNDLANRYHINHGQLGFALKDKIVPEWEEAERELTLAIKIRGPWREQGWLFYEFNRAICRIQNDPMIVQNLPTDTDRKNQILEDLRAAIHSKDIEQILKSDPTINKWMSLNKIDWDSLNND
ncbi:hypothetical protein ACX1N5_11810 [Acinetobacter sp. ANC 4636]